MYARSWQVVALLAIGLNCGCSATKGKPFDPGLTNREFYLCCNMRFNLERAATDSNYARYISNQVYQEGPILEAGTRVKVVKVGESGIAFQPDAEAVPYTLAFRYGRKQQSASQYFRNILRETNPMDSVNDVSLTIATAIRAGRLVPGMTKEQALIARGYPPAHRTPSLDANEWIYYDTPGFVDRVVFSGGKLQSVTRGPAPQ